ncbi:hypothetical protein [Chitinophaga silvisoli]|uniref:Uncharacterized protein n=1 Tax=Chitinophaga silvisoli TaxID=2291814 RepID=A0A3E1P486_9BACT|nr:hypothetical protein [Chitinophaga silvisoli]RFM35013.1 hypothetical protein DXN04_06320 [Chitinophaga silvisoli]
MKDLWPKGIFWMAIMFATTYMVMMMVNGHFSWYHYVFILTLLPGLLVIISSIIMVRPETLSGRDFIGLIKHTSKLIYGSILTIVSRKDREQP